MTDEIKAQGCVILLLLALLAAILATAMAWRWYRSGVQQSVYQRQGIDMTQWECFIGIEPAERVMQIREDGRTK